MNEIYLTIMLFVALYVFTQTCVVPDLMTTDSGLRIGSTFAAILALCIMLVMSGAAPLGDDIVEIKPATNTRVGDDLIIQSVGWPTQVINDIRFVDKTVQIKKVTPQNAWGGDLSVFYCIETLTPEEAN